MSSVVATTAVRGRFLDIQNTVAQARDIHDQVRYVEDGLLIAKMAKFAGLATGKPASSIFRLMSTFIIIPTSWIVPGFIDTHIHFPQTEMVGAYGNSCLNG